MPKWAIDAIAAIAGIAVGAGGVVAVGPAGLDASDTCSADLEIVRSEHAALTQEAEQLQANVKQRASELATVEGPRLEWPSGVPEIETEAAYTPILDEALGTIENAERRALDCSEYPCIAVVRFGVGADGSRDFAKLQDTLKGRGFEVYDTLSGGTRLADPFPTGEERDITVFAMVPPEEARPDGMSQRVGIRINRVVKQQIQDAMRGDQ